MRLKSRRILCVYTFPDVKMMLTILSVYKIGTIPSVYPIPLSHSLRLGLTSAIVVVALGFHQRCQTGEIFAKMRKMAKL